MYCFQDWYDRLSLIDTQRAQFHTTMNAKIVRRRKTEWKAKFYFTCDPLAMAVAIDPTTAVDTDTKYCTVELHGQATRGQMVVDWMGKMGKSPNVNIVTKVDADKTMRFFENMLS